MKLYGTPPTRAVRPLWLLNELALDVDLVVVDVPAGEHRGEAFRAINPLGKVPALVDDDVAMGESSAIPFYLAERYGGARFLPDDPGDRARMMQWIFFLVAEVEQPLWRMARHQLIYPEAERVPQDIPVARRDLHEALGVLEDHMAGRDHLVGDRPTLADFNAAYTLDWAGFDDSLGAAPRLRGFVERMYARPAAPPRIAEGFRILDRGGIPPRYRHQLDTADRLSPAL
jgi:glutathione S-transferase